MILPKEKVVYENLNTSFTGFAELLADLKTNHFTGVIHISFWEYEGVLFMDSGDITNALEDMNGYRKIEQEAINGILNKVKEKHGMISVYGLSSELVTMLAGTAKSEIIYKELTSDFTDLGKLLEKLHNEQHTGYIELLSKEDKHIATIFMHAGDPIESIISTKETTFAETGINSMIFDIIEKDSAVFNVYRAWFETSTTQLITATDIIPLFEFWEKVIRMVEKKFTEGDFLRIFKDAMIANAEAYPFLDPFAAEFNYIHGKIIFEGEYNTDFSNGIAKVLADILSRHRGITINTELKTLQSANETIIEKYALQNLLQTLQ